MSPSYKSEYPAGLAVDSSIISFFENFYRISDTPGNHEAYADNFTDDATFILASKVSRGRSQIISTRKGMWANIGARRHAPTKIFPFGNNSRAFMLHGDVAFAFRDGRQGTLPWAARAELVQSPAGGWKMRFYQVYLDTLPLRNTGNGVDGTKSSEST
ncbi:hypothetical protein SODALDRAFT_353535 [Sodiomyces alkalinus F11]|uniref:SnoaL-like domain-containing protein n=1 Tax=Sodiomyces alkalinus (strain CBS 110278 / VKM F-3762 / F11) TaxID=1314773 RepID=A0A3N2PKW1_SODAK|nr:hypothetical protein SODALDRAFT_353535 [Sodiomyces alkalinus F11]ROT35155.1 hypothetical protein SODALDRAFT_353535 [Sodiomyces alkalinus F11]